MAAPSIAYPVPGPETRFFGGDNDSLKSLSINPKRKIDQVTQNPIAQHLNSDRINTETPRGISEKCRGGVGYYYLWDMTIVPVLNTSPRRFTATSHFVRDVLPPTPGNFDVPNHFQGGVVFNPRPPALASSNLLFRKKLHHSFVNLGSIYAFMICLFTLIDINRCQRLARCELSRCLVSLGFFVAS
jgi:hypothetical protein